MNIRRRLKIAKCLQRVQREVQRIMKEPLKNRIQSILDEKKLKNQWESKLEKQLKQPGKETAYSNSITKKTICPWDSINYETD